MTASGASPAARLLGHPLVITFFGAVLAALVLPPLTRGWQDRQKELELKRALVSQIAETSTVAVRRGIVAKKESERTAVRREWLVQRSVTNAIVATYFPALADCWFVYSDIITSFLALPDTASRQEIDRNLAATREECDWDDDLPRAETERLNTLETKLSEEPDSLSNLGELLLIGKDGIIRRIVAEDARGYAHGPF